MDIVFGAAKPVDIFYFMDFVYGAPQPVATAWEASLAGFVMVASVIS